MASMSSGQARQLVGRVLRLPATRRRLAFRLKIIRVTVDPADAERITVHGIRVNDRGREVEGRTILLTPSA